MWKEPLTWDKGKEKVKALTLQTRVMARVRIRERVLESTRARARAPRCRVLWYDFSVICDIVNIIAPSHRYKG